jgi:hypothetical protein
MIDILIFLKHLGRSYFPITKGFNFEVPIALVANNTVNRDLS